MQSKITLIIIILCLLGIAAFVFSNNEGISETDNKDSMSKIENADIKKEIIFPYEIESGKLKILSLFQSSIENPDAYNELQENIASLEILNQSDEYCEHASVIVCLEDGTQLEFEISDIPPRRTVWAFDIHNVAIDSEYVCVDVSGEASFGKESYIEDEVSFHVEDTTITVQNKTDQELVDLLVKCHCLFDEAYFGGITYEYPISTIPAHGQVVIEADDCFMGIAEVVSIIKN